LLIEKEAQTTELAKHLGTEAVRVGQYERAEPLLKLAVEQGHYHPRLFATLALACKYQGKSEEAIEWNLRALEMDKLDLDAIVNMGHIYYENRRWPEAKEYYEKALSIEHGQSDVLFRLSMLSLIVQDLEACIAYCHDLLEELGSVKNIVAESVDDFSQLYRLIGEAFLATGKQWLHSEAMNMATMLETQQLSIA